MTLYITGEEGENLAGYIRFMNEAGAVVGEQAIPAGGTELSEQYLNAADNVVVGAAGHYEFGVPVYTLNAGDNEFQLLKKPSVVKYIAIGAIAFFALSQFKK